MEKSFHLLPQGAVFPDLGCDRKCDFCQTPTYKTGYKRMTPERTLQWFARQQEAGAIGKFIVVFLHQV